MLPNGIDPPLQMLTMTQKVRETERMLQDLTRCEKPIEIPGNFRAQQRRRKHDDSKLVFPERKGKRNERYETNYTLNFKQRSNSKPSKERPCSPTRRNNPHPSKNFLTWRIPTRVFDYGKSKKANISFLNSNIDDTHQSFYNDYSGHRNDQNQVNTKLLLEMTKSYTGFKAPKKKEKRRRGTIELTSQASHHALTLPSLLRKSWSPDQSSLGLPRRQQLSPLLLKEDVQPLFQSWYDSASANDKDTDSKLTGIAAEIEESYIQKALENALRPDAIEAIEDWLLQANEEERAIAMQFIQTILLASLEKQKASMETQTEETRPQPKSRPPVSKSNRKHDHHHTKGCKVCSNKKLESALQHLQMVATMPQDLPGITELLNPLHPGVILQREERKKFLSDKNRKLARPKQGSSTFKPDSLFVASHKPQGRHFTIHPEWF